MVSINLLPPFLHQPPYPHSDSGYAESAIERKKGEAANFFGLSFDVFFRTNMYGNLALERHAVWKLVMFNEG